jgi:hypothetical protein
MLKKGNGDGEEKGVVEAGLRTSWVEVKGRLRGGELK